MGLISAGIVEYSGALTALEHVAMLACMLGAMLLRPGEYSCHVHAPTAPGKAAGVPS